MEETVPVLDKAGIDHSIVFEVGCPYISGARATMLTKALERKADYIVFLDHDVAWQPSDMLKLLEADGDIVAGTYRFKIDDNESYMGCIDTDPETHQPMGRDDGCLSATRVPAGFLRVSRPAIEAFKKAYPELCISDGIGVDLFNHGAIDGTWFGEDYAFSKRWKDMGGMIWLIPDLNIDHTSHNGNRYPGNFHKFMLRQPGGSEYHEGQNAYRNSP
jgi:glycosyltransferase involved in cell wall biosynthesis